MVTIKDVAKSAGVSYSTVSRALADSPLVDSKTKKKILRVAESLHYVPNQMARGLKGGKSKTILLVVPTLINTFFPQLIMYFEEELRQRGYALLLGVSNYDKAEERRCFETARTFSADGVLFVSGTDDCDHMQKLIDNFGAPVVLVNRVWNLGVTCVTNDNKSGAYHAIEHLIGRGHRRVACVIGDISIQHFRERYEGCVQAFQDNGIPLENVQFLHRETSQQVYEAACALFDGPDRPTAFFVASDWLASGVYSAAAHCGLSVPADVSVVGFDDIENSKYMIPPLTTWHHSIDEIAGIAADMQVRRIDGETQGWGSTIVVPGRLVERGSVSAPPAGADGGTV